MNNMIIRGDISEEEYSGNASLLNITILECSSIGNGAFAYCYNLEEVRISGSLTNISAGCFYDCHNLQKVQLPNNIKFIQNHAFHYCGNLQQINFPDALEEIEDYAFIQCNISLPKFNKKLKKIDYSCFQYCYMIEEIKLFEEIEHIDHLAFCYCTNLLTFSCNSNKITFIGSGLFQYCFQLREVHFAKTFQVIPPYFFRECENLVSFNLDDKITKIESGAFYNCVSFPPFNFPETLKEIGDSTFFSTSFETVVIPKNVVSIGYSAFAYCTKLKSFIFNNDFLELNHSIFSYTSSLTKIVLPRSITRIRYSCFQSSAITEITLPPNLQVLDSDVFNNCSCLKSINLPTTITYIDSYCFFNCTLIKELIISAKTRSGSSFKDMKSLSKVVFTEGVETINDDEFANFTSLKEVQLPTTLKESKDNSFLNTSIRSIYLHNRVISIGNCAFLFCNELEEVIFENGMTQLHIGDNAFTNDQSLKRIQLPNIPISFGINTFSGVNKIEEIHIYASYTGRNNDPFYCMSDLKKVILEEGIDTIYK